MKPTLKHKIDGDTVGVTFGLGFDVIKKGGYLN